MDKLVPQVMQADLIFYIHNHLQSGAYQDKKKRVASRRHGLAILAPDALGTGGGQRQCNTIKKGRVKETRPDNIKRWRTHSRIHLFFFFVF